MNITESNQLTTLLAWLLGEKARPDLPPPPAPVAREAAACLAARANRTLGAGITPDGVRTYWPTAPLCGDGTLDADARLIRALANRMETRLGQDPQMPDPRSLTVDLANAIHDLALVAEHIFDEVIVPAHGDPARESRDEILDQIKGAARALHDLEGWL